jgi:SAM-dependent methyltransferase
MYITTVWNGEKGNDFDWDAFFSEELQGDILKKIDPKAMFAMLRKHLSENKFKMTFALSKVMRELLNALPVKQNPRILELGAATGFLSRWLIGKYGGEGVLVDNNRSSYDAFTAMNDPLKSKFTYLLEDLFTLELDEAFDIVCSFGLVEHFPCKQKVMEAHTKFVSGDGFVIILVPMDTPLTRAFLEVHPELNLGYRELMTEKELKKMLNDAGLNILKTGVSFGYSYDFAGAVCEVL